MDKILLSASLCQLHLQEQDEWSVWTTCTVTLCPCVFADQEAGDGGSGGGGVGAQGFSVRASPKTTPR